MTWLPGMVVGLTSKPVVSDEVVLIANNTELQDVFPFQLSPCM